MFLHTPGPWIARKLGKNWAIDFNEDQEQVVDFVYEEADAYLIAVAPELLKAVFSAEIIFRELSKLGHGSETCRAQADKLAALIAKARGEQPCS